MSAEAEAAQVEQEYRREEKREHKAMDAKLLAPKFNAKLIAEAYVDNLSTVTIKAYFPATESMYNTIHAVEYTLNTCSNRGNT
jgi:hypothetical protein